MKFWFRAAVGVFAVSVMANGVLFVAPASSAAPEQQGVTKDKITIAAVFTDLDSLQAKGLLTSKKQTVQNSIDKWKAFMPKTINGRTVDFQTALWDPLDVTSYARACQQLTQDIKPFVVLNSAAWRQDQIPCLTVDGNTPFMNAADPVNSQMFKLSGNKLFTIMPPSDVAGATTAEAAAKYKLVPKTAKIGILSSNDLGVKSAMDTLESGLKKRGYNVAQKIELNQLSGDAAALNTASQAAVDTFKSAGVDTVFVGPPFSFTVGYFQAANRQNAGFKNFLVDDSSGLCNYSQASRIPAEAAGTPCITASDTRAVSTKDSIKKDSAFEAKCRVAFEKQFNETTNPGVPGGDITVNGQTITEDMGPEYCNLTSILFPAIKAAGKNLTWDKVANNMVKMSNIPLAYVSDGKGSYAKGKQYASDFMHLMVMNPANKDTVKDANGLYNGCPAPVNCMVPQLINGKEWFPVGQPG